MSNTPCRGPIQLDFNKIAYLKETIVMNDKASVVYTVGLAMVDRGQKAACWIQKIWPTK